VHAAHSISHVSIGCLAANTIRLELDNRIVLVARHLIDAREVLHAACTYRNGLVMIKLSLQKKERKI